MLLNCTILHYTLLYYTAFFYIIQNILFVMYHVIIPHSAGLLSCQIFILRSIMLLACHAKLYPYYLSHCFKQLSNRMTPHNVTAGIPQRPLLFSDSQRAAALVLGNLS